MPDNRGVSMVRKSAAPNVAARSPGSPGRPCPTAPPPNPQVAKHMDKLQQEKEHKAAEKLQALMPQLGPSVRALALQECQWDIDRAVLLLRRFSVAHSDELRVLQKVRARRRARARVCACGVGWVGWGGVGWGGGGWVGGGGESGERTHRHGCPRLLLQEQPARLARPHLLRRRPHRHRLPHLTPPHTHPGTKAPRALQADGPSGAPAEEGQGRGRQEAALAVGLQGGRRAQQ
jgi:hypothetical protein